MYAIPCLTWVKKGCAKSQPDHVRLSQEEIDDLFEKSTKTKGKKRAILSEETNEDTELRDEEEETEKSDDEEKVESDEDADVETRYGLDQYSSDSDEEEDMENPMVNVSSLAFYKSDQSDPHLSKKDQLDVDEDLFIEPDDNLVVFGKFHRDFSSLNVYVYNEKKDYLYCHHDSLLPEFPLCVEWLDFDPGEEEGGNLAAVGGIEPHIEIWDLDILDTLEAAFTLKGVTKKKKKKLKTICGHSDAVLGLSWNHNQRNVLASASADHTVGLWDLSEGKMVASLSDHEDKVQTVQWHPNESQTILSGGFDQMVKIFDCRSPKSAVKSWHISSDVEQGIWNCHDSNYLLVAAESGQVYCYDMRVHKPVFELSAHDSTVSGIALSSITSGCLVTASEDRSIKVWDIRKSKPKNIFSKKLNVGQLHCISACPDVDWLFAVGGEREIRILNLAKQPAVANHFGLTSATAEEDKWEKQRTDESGESSKEEDEETEKKKKIKKKKKSESNSEGASKKRKKETQQSAKIQKKKMKKKAKQIP